MMKKVYLCIDLKTFFASCECSERHLDPFKTNLVVADPTRGNGALCLAILLISHLICIFIIRVRRSLRRC